MKQGDIEKNCLHMSPRKLVYYAFELYFSARVHTETNCLFLAILQGTYERGAVRAVPISKLIFKTVKLLLQ